jgi:hypothetical protein
MVGVADFDDVHCFIYYQHYHLKGLVLLARSILKHEVTFFFTFLNYHFISVDNKKARIGRSFLLHPHFLSMALPAISGPRLLIQFHNQFSQTVGFLGRVISPSQGRYLNTGQHSHRISSYTNKTSIP